MKQNKKVFMIMLILLVALLVMTACQKPADKTNFMTDPSDETDLPLSTAQSGSMLVEINMDNWQEYFELKTIDRWGDNGNGEFTAVTQLTGLWVREEYWDRIVNEGDTSILCELSFERTERKIDVDYQSKTYTWGETVSRQQECQVSERINYFTGYPNGEQMVFGTGNTVEKGNTVMQRDENMELTSIEGVLSLHAE